MTDYASIEERKRSDSLRAIYDLIRNDEIPRLDMFLKRANSAEGDYRSYAYVSQSGYVGLVANFVRCEGMLGSVARDECYGCVVVL